jgi:two-component system chemotaxis response regulator CheY
MGRRRRRRQLLRGCRKPTSSDTLDPMRVLIVDDSPACRAQARHAVEAAQATIARVPGDVDVTEATGGVEALRELASAPVDLLVVDLNMPLINGLELLSFWGSRAERGSRAVVVSTDVSPVDRARACAFGAVAFCDKPVSPEALVAALASIPD